MRNTCRTWMPIRSRLALALSLLLVVGGCSEGEKPEKAAVPVRSEPTASVTPGTPRAALPTRGAEATPIATPTAAGTTATTAPTDDATTGSVAEAPWPDDGSADLAFVVPGFDDTGLSEAQGMTNIRVFLYDRANKKGAANVIIVPMGKPLAGGPWRTNQAGFAVLQADPTEILPARVPVRLEGNWLPYRKGALAIERATNGDLVTNVDLSRREGEVVRVDVVPAVEVVILLQADRTGDQYFSDAPVRISPVNALAKEPLVFMPDNTKANLPRFRVPGRIGDRYRVGLDESHYGAAFDLFEFAVEQTDKPIVYTHNMLTRQGGVSPESH
jgi:hypothetical protein